jgi:hypothetical protein
MKTFTLEEAQSILPVVESLLERVNSAHEAALRIERKMGELRIRIFHSGGMTVNVAAVARDVADKEKHNEAVMEVMDEFKSIGVQVKDIDQGLLDFPCMVDGEMVLLCWKRGESQIEYWHTLDAGYEGRQKLDARFRRVKSDKPN